MYKLLVRTVAVPAIAILALAAAPGIARATIIADLATDWSNTSNPNNSNPNGTWEYRQGTTDITNLVPDWQSLYSGTPAQPSWAPSNTSGNFLPAMFKATTTLDPVNWQVGNIIMHTVDGFNGNPSLGVGNYLFTSAVSGTFDIVGDVWNPESNSISSSRPQDWNLLVDGVSVASGSLNGLVSQASPNTFDITDVAFVAGTTVDLQLYMDSASCCGYFVGSNLTIETAPEPASLTLLGAGLAGLGLIRRRKRAQ